MEVHFLGTAAAEGWPALWCRCAHCAEARRRGGRDIRTRAGALVDGRIKIDLGPDTYMQALRDGVDLGAVEHLLVTHSHEDHFSPEELAMRAPPFGHGAEHELTIWAGEKPLHAARQVLKAYGTPHISLRLVRPFEPFQAGDARITPLLADHDPLETCLIYAIERQGKRLLWGHDTGIFPEETWRCLEGQAPFDAVVLDCTNGPLPGKRGHLGIEGVLEVKAEMLQRHLAHPATRFVATHFSHNGGLLQADLEERLGPEGVLVAYDGMRLRI